MNNILKSKKGFTLVELSIVIALIGIVVSMAVGFIAQYNKDTYSLVRNRNAMNDINNIRRITNEWVKYYDNGQYTITPSDSGSGVLQATKDGKVDKLFIENGKFVWKMNNDTKVYKAYALNSVTTLKYDFTKTEDKTAIKDKSGKEVKNVIKCTVYFNDNRNWENLLFSILSKSPRSRYSPAEV